MKVLLLIIAVATISGCGSQAQPVSNSQTNEKPMRSEQLQSTTDHTFENRPLSQPPVNNTGGRWSQDGDPIDTTELDKAIADAEKTRKADPNDGAAKKELAEAYFKRGVALTDARQYASALGDYRRVLKLEPDHADAKKWEEQIIGIYQMMKKEYPKPGEEPKPLPYKKESGK